VISELVAERRAMREELEVLRSRENVVLFWGPGVEHPGRRPRR
jgi:hypothetical protein